MIHYIKKASQEEIDKIKTKNGITRIQQIVLFLEKRW